MRLIAAVLIYCRIGRRRSFSIQPTYTKEGRVSVSLILRAGLTSRRQCSVTALGTPEETARSQNPDTPPESLFLAPETGKSAET